MDDFYEAHIADAAAENTGIEHEVINSPQAEDAATGTQNWEHIKNLWHEYQRVTEEERRAKTRSNQLRIEMGREFRALQEEHAKPGHGDFLELLPAKLEELGISISIKTIYEWIKLSREADGLEVRNKRTLKRSETSSFTNVKDDTQQPQPEQPQITVQKFEVPEDEEATEYEAETAAGGAEENTSTSAVIEDSQPDPEPCNPQPKTTEEYLIERFRKLLVAPDTNPVMEFYSIVFAAAKLLDVPREVLPGGLGITVYRKEGVASCRYAHEGTAAVA
jgi:hypothetical protein